jgi:hypothetical protein
LRTADGRSRREAIVADRHLGRLKWADCGHSLSGMKTAWLQQERSSPFSPLNTAKCYLVVIIRYLRKCPREVRFGLGSRGGSLAV